MSDTSKSTPVKTFEDLNVYQKAYALALDIHKASLTMPKIEQYALADQIRRASKSICGNIAEGFAKQRHSSPEFRRFISMAIGSADEMKVWLRFCGDLTYFSTQQVKAWSDEYVSVAKMLSKLREKWT
jgi:four helix bundle protein